MVIVAMKLKDVYSLEGKLLKSVHLEAVLDGMGRFLANTVYALLSPGIQFPANFAI